jgi:hypothetical protein
MSKLQAGLSKPRGAKDVATIMERLGRAKQRFARAAQHYQVDVSTSAGNPSGTQVSAITWTKRVKPGSAAAHPGVYCQRTTLVEQDDSTLWRTYTMLTNLESVFRSLKTDLGLRPVFHRIDWRVEGHLFISVWPITSRTCCACSSRQRASMKVGRPCATHWPRSSA